MRNVQNILEDKMDEAVTHYINSHQHNETVHVDSNQLALNLQNDHGNRIVTVMHPHNYTSQLCSRQVSINEQVGDGPWNDDLLDSEARLTAIVAHLAQQPRTSHHPSQVLHHKMRDDTSVMVDSTLRLFNGQTLDQTSDQIVVQVPQVSLPPLQEMKRCQDTGWFNKIEPSKNSTTMLDDIESSVLEMSASSSPAQNKQSKKSLPHKKRISKKLRRNTGCSTPQQHTQNIIVLNCPDSPQQEEILPDSFVTHQHAQHLNSMGDQTQHITHEVRPILICQLCGDFFGDDQLKFYHHLKQHYEPHTIIIENPVSDLGIDKMTNTCIVDNVSTLPDSIVELSLENTVPKTMYQTIDKHTLYTSCDRTPNYNSYKYSIANMDKEHEMSEAEKNDIYAFATDMPLDKINCYGCIKLFKSFKKQKMCVARIKENLLDVSLAHSNTNPKIEDMTEFSEPEDLMEGIHVGVGVDDCGETVADAEESTGAEAYGANMLPTLTIESGHVSQDHIRHWYNQRPCSTSDGSYCDVCPTREQDTHEQPQIANQQIKVEVLRRLLETGVPNIEHNTFPNDNVVVNDVTNIPEPPEEVPMNKPVIEKREGTLVKVVKEVSEIAKADPVKKYECSVCKKAFTHRNSLLYHALSHKVKQHVCNECGKCFYTRSVLKIHIRMHNGERPFKCEECGKTFRQWSDLKNHKTSLHSDKKNFKCDFCGKEFARKYSLSVHRRIHTGEKNYKCEYCNKSFRASSYRLAHMRTHTGDRPHKCTECEKSFRVRCDLRRHMKIHKKASLKLEESLNKELEKPSIIKKPNQNVVSLKADQKKDSSPQVKKVKNIAVASTAKCQTLKKNGSPDKKIPVKTKKPNKSANGAPNVTVTQMSYETNGAVFDNRQLGPMKFKELYCDDQIVNGFSNKKDAFNHPMMSDGGRLSDNEFAILKPIISKSNAQLCDSSVTLHTTGNTDDKLSVFTIVDKTSNVSPLDVREEHNDAENGFLERLTALYNIPAV